MKTVFYKSLSFLMAIVVLYSTMSFTISSHYCGDTLVDSVIFSKLKTCGMESDNPSDASRQSSDCSITKANCCSDDFKIIKGQDELKISFDKISFDNQIFVAAFFHAYKHLFINSKEVALSVNDYPPPMLVRHIYKIDQTYLI